MATIAPSSSEMTGESLRILQFVTGLRIGGAEKLTTDLSIALRQHGHEVTVASRADDRDAFARKLRENGVDLIWVPFPKPGLRALARTILHLRRVIRATDPDIIHAHNPAAGTIALVARLLARRRRLPVVATYHGVRPHRLRLAGYVMSGADAVIAVGPSAAAQLRDALPRERVVEINNAVVVERSRSTADVRAEFGVSDGLMLVSVGRCVPQKGQLLLLDMLAELCRREQPRDVTLVIVGDGPLLPDLEARAAELGLGDKVVFAGGRSDAPDIIGSADVLVHTANWEGLPLVLLEAMVLMVPIAAIAATGVSDIVRDRGTGRLVEDRDPAALCDAIEEILDDGALRASVVAAAAALVERDYPISAMVDSHVSLYTSLVTARSPSR